MANDEAPAVCFVPGLLVYVPDEKHVWKLATVAKVDQNACSVVLQNEKV